MCLKNGKAFPEDIAEDNPLEIAIEQNMEIEAIFVERVGPAPTYSLTVTFDAEQGSVSGIPDDPSEIEEGTVITLTAVPAEGFVFDSWTGVPEGKDKDNPVEFVINSNTTVTAEFAAVVIKPEEDFEGFELEHSFNTLGWGGQEAVVADDPVNSGNKVLKFICTNYGAAPILEFTIPEGKTLADYSTFTYKGIFSGGDISWKHIHIAVFSEEPSGQYAPEDPAIIGDYNRAQEASNEWENITIDITNVSDITGKIYVIIGINSAGATWYADDIKFVEKAE